VGIKLKREVKIKDIIIGGNSEIVIQSMLNKRPDDIEGNVQQARELYSSDCKIIRVSIPNENALKLIGPLKKAVPCPIVADIHFDYKLALKSVELGIDKIRINPGNIGDDEKVKQVVEACKNKNIPIRIGVNGGSLERHILQKYKMATPDALVESALYHIRLLEKFGFYDIIVSLKSSNVKDMIKAYEIIDKKVDYPLHLGVTEAGTERMGLIKSSIGIGSLLAKGIGNTIRVSLTEDPVKEITAAKDILKALDLHKDGATMVSCPTCGRTEIDLIPLAKKIEEFLATQKKKITVAVMGCVVNGPGEAREADIGIAGGRGKAVIFKKGLVLRTVDEKDIITELKKEIEKL